MLHHIYLLYDLTRWWIYTHLWNWIQQWLCLQLDYASLALIQNLFNIYLLVYQSWASLCLFLIVLGRLHQSSYVRARLPALFRLIAFLRRQDHLKKLVLEVSALTSVAQKFVYKRDFRLKFENRVLIGGRAECWIRSIIYTLIGDLFSSIFFNITLIYIAAFRGFIYCRGRKKTSILIWVKGWWLSIVGCGFYLFNNCSVIIYSSANLFDAYLIQRWYSLWHRVLMMLFYKGCTTWGVVVRYALTTRHRILIIHFIIILMQTLLSALLFFVFILQSLFNF